jgi:flagellar basal-body rod protein FlgG
MAMADPITDAYSALEARMRIVDVITNNLANANTTGFKRDFAHILQGQAGFDIGTQVDLAAGDIVQTGNPLDAAIDGPGFFAIQTPNGVRYTRNGSFSLNANGELVTKDGMAVLNSSGGTINVSHGKVAIQDGGIVTVDGNESAALKIVTFNDPKKVQKEGLYRLAWTGSADDVQDVPAPHVTSGALEHSNVNAVDEMVHLMSAYREFESVQRTLRTLMTDLNGKLTQEMGRLS